MAKGLINAAGGLSAADKETVRQWMVEGHDILRGKVAGSISRKAAATYTPGTSDQVLEAGQYLQGAQTIAGDANLAAGNIRSGVSIFGVAGTYQTPIKSIGIYTFSMQGNPADNKGLYGFVRCSDASLIDDVTYYHAEWGSNRHVVPFKRPATLICYGISPYKCEIAGLPLVSGLQIVDVVSGSQIGITQYTHVDAVPSTIVFLEF